MNDYRESINHGILLPFNGIFNSCKISIAKRSILCDTTHFNIDSIESYRVQDFRRESFSHVTQHIDFFMARAVADRSITASFNDNRDRTRAEILSFPIRKENTREKRIVQDELLECILLPMTLIYSSTSCLGIECHLIRSTGGCFSREPHRQRTIFFGNS